MRVVTTPAALLLISVLGCPAPKMQNVSGLAWNDYDRSILKQAKKRCGELYEDSPCVKLFRKFDFQAYTVICGEPDGR